MSEDNFLLHQTFKLIETRTELLFKRFNFLRSQIAKGMNLMNFKDKRLKAREQLEDFVQRSKSSTRLTRRVVAQAANPAWVI